MNNVFSRLVTATALVFAVLATTQLQAKNQSKLAQHEDGSVKIAEYLARSYPVHAEKSTHNLKTSRAEKWPMLPKNPTFKESFLPLNRITIPKNAPRLSEVTEQVFVTILNKIWGAYAADFGARGLLFRPAMNWQDDTFNAYAYQENGIAYVVMLGGLARFSELTADGFAFVACHEVGHHLGGLPTYPEGASTEGAADYFAAVKCLRRMFALNETWGVASPFSPFKAKLMDPYALQLCDSVYALPADRRICYRITAAAQSIANAFYAVARSEGIPVQPPQFSTPSRDVAKFALAHHPPTQCRLDTGLQGALCAAPLTDTFSFGSVVKGGCHPLARKYRIGFRPSCWYNDQAPPKEYWDWLTQQQIKKQQEQQIRVRARVSS